MGNVSAAEDAGVISNLNATMDGRGLTSEQQRRNTIAFVHQRGSALEDLRVQSNDDLSVVGSGDANSATSDELSANSETYDFLMVCMPIIRPIDPAILAEEARIAAEEAAAKKGPKGKKAPQARKSTAAISLKSNSLAEAKAQSKESAFARQQTFVMPSKRMSSFGQSEADQLKTSLDNNLNGIDTILEEQGSVM